MRLKSLEIKGFKSFADKTVVNFDENITGIVGPNGCGKSNIVDSIRWVIGEQKISHLRSENLESLVFNGSKTRSASGLAEVTLTFENTRNLLPIEFNTVTITRKFYKSGESEYRLNDVQCRLKDIQNLFMDTGISTDSYAIIELGMVDDLIKDKEGSRRRMLEQAAGISIYKTRKREARVKLDATEQDLSRIEDLLFEINNQLKTLESQSKKAEKYYEIKKDYREVSIELAKAALEGFNLTFKELSEQHETESDKRAKLDADIALEEAKLEEEKVALIETERALQSMQHRFNDLVQSVRSKENEKNLAAQRLEHLKDKETGLKDFLVKAEAQVKGLEESVNFTTGQINEEERSAESLQGELSQLRAQVDQRRQVLDEKRSVVNILRNDFQQVQRSQFEAEKKVAVADTSIQNIHRAIQQIEDERSNRDFQRKQLADDLFLKEKELKIKQTDLVQLQHHNEYTKDQILQTQAILDGLRNKLGEEGRRLDAKKNEHDLLKSLIDSMEGYPESVKFLHNNPGWEAASPILSDIVYVKEEFRAAVENVLEPFLNYYVVGSLQDGLRAVHLLDDNKKGKANFFLLDQINEASASQQTVSADEAARLLPGSIPALSVVDVDEKYRKLAEYLLGNVYIAEDERALENSNGFTVLEKSGKYVKGKFSLTGGSVGLFEGRKIGRRKNLEKLKEQISAQHFVVEKLKDEIQARHNEVIAFNEDLRESAISDTEHEIQLLTNQVFSLHNKLENLHALQNQGQQRLETLHIQLQQTQSSVEGVRLDLTHLNEDLQLNTNRLREAEETFKSEEAAYNDLTKDYNEFNLRVTRQQSKIAALKQEFEFKNNQVRELQSQMEANATALLETGENILQSGEALRSAEALLVDLMKNKETEERKLNEADQSYYNVRNDLNAKESALRHKVREREQAEHLLTGIKDRLNDLKLRLAGTRERLNVEFRIQ
ncbi:MAG TPA: chromosome segregation protein SMC, partial [Chitinophagaceae bacterium]